MVFIAKEQSHFLFDRSLPPAATVAPGTQICFETMDACCGEVRSVEQYLKRRATQRQSNPLTGPVFIEGVQPGNTLVVDIVNVELDAEGFQLIGPQRALIRDEIETWTCYAFKVKDGRAVFECGIEVPVAPVIGSFGNAPAGPPTNRPNRLGGNQDVPAVRTGARLYIPVEVEGALFSLGDVHACQGDGEVVGAPEIGARVTVRLDVLKASFCDWYMIEDSECWHTACSASSEAEAARLAVHHNARFIRRTYGVELHDAFILLTLMGRLSLSRTGPWGDHGPVVCSSFSKADLQAAISSYSPRKIK